MKQDHVLKTHKKKTLNETYSERLGSMEKIQNAKL